MRHNTLRSLLAILAIAPAMAFGQEIELGQVLDKGAVRLSKAELESLVPGTTTKFTQWTTGPQGQGNVEYYWENPVGVPSTTAVSRSSCGTHHTKDRMPLVPSG